MQDGYSTFVDECDYAKLNLTKWRIKKTDKMRYVVQWGRPSIQMHHVIAKEMKAIYQDHRDRDGFNNLRSNLICTPIAPKTIVKLPEPIVRPKVMPAIPLDTRTNLMRSDGRCCVYCGDYYQCRDHIVPVAWESVYRTYRPGDTVPCCSECNSYLGDRPIFTLEDRAHYLVDAYITKRRDILSYPLWTEAEIEALGYSLREPIRRTMYLKDLYRLKLSNLCLSESGSLVQEIHPIERSKMG